MYGLFIWVTRRVTVAVSITPSMGEHLYRGCGCEDVDVYMYAHHVRLSHRRQVTLYRHCLLLCRYMLSPIYTYPPLPSKPHSHHIVHPHT